MKRTTKQQQSRKTKPEYSADSWFRTTLYSIGDAVITLDEHGNVLQVNHVAEALTGWTEPEASGKHINEIIRIVDETTKLPVDNPFEKVIREGTVVGLANHSLLISRDGREIPIADSGAPIRDNTGKIIGVVLVFRDQSHERDRENKLLESERRLTTLMANLPGMSYRCRNDRNWTMEFLSEGCRQLTGYDPEDFIENKRIPYNGIIHPDDRDHLWATWQHVLQTNKKFQGEYRIITKDGSLKWVWEQGQGVFSENGDLLALEGFITDITDRKRVQAELFNSQKMIESILNTIPVRVFWKDRDGFYLGCNTPFALDAGLKSPDEMIGKDDYQMGWIDQAELYRSDDRAVIESGKARIGYEEPQTTPGGARRWLRTSKIPLRDSDNEIIGVLGTYEDISEQKQSEQALRESEEKYRSLFEESKDAIYISTPDGKILDINNAGLELFGYSSKSEMQELDVGQDLYINREDREASNRLLNQKDYVKDLELVLKRKDGKAITVLETATTVRDKSGTVVAHRGILRDITRQRMLEEQLRHVQKMESIGTLAGGIAHDFNNILSIIVGHASLLKMHKSDPDRLTRGVDTILKATERGASLVQQLLTFARKSDVTYESVSVNDIITEIAQLLYETLPKKIEVKVNLEHNISPIIADVTQIHQVLLNLALNARDAMPKGGVLTVSSETVHGKTIRSDLLVPTAPEYILIRVSDTGTGMDEWTKQRIFDPFFTTKRPGKGTGLGLSLVYSIVESLNGFVDVDSQRDTGTTFSIYLPVAQTGNIPAEVSSRTEIENHQVNETILIIEDEELLLDSLRSILLERGYSVITARDGKEGIEMYSLHSKDLFGKGIDVVICDLGLPKVSGDEVYKKIRNINPAVKVILASGFIDPSVKMGLKNAGMKYFVQKPYIPDKIFKAIRQVLDDNDL